MAVGSPYLGLRPAPWRLPPWFDVLVAFILGILIAFFFQVYIKLSTMQPAPKITVVLGNIVKQADCDGVVNAANKNLRAGSGVCGAIHDAAGKDLEAYASKFGPLNVGEALATPAFNLPCRYIIHTVGPKYWSDPTPEESLRRAIRNTLLLADENGLKRLAVPAISTGVYGYPPEEAVPIIVAEAFFLTPKLESLQEIRFVVRESHMYEVFTAALEQSNGHAPGTGSNASGG